MYRACALTPAVFMPSASSPSAKAPMPTTAWAGVHDMPPDGPCAVRGCPAAMTCRSQGIRSGNSMVRPTTTVPSAAGRIFRLVHMT